MVVSSWSLILWEIMNNCGRVMVTVTPKTLMLWPKLSGRLFFKTLFDIISWILLILVFLIQYCFCQLSEWDYLLGSWGYRGTFCDEEMTMCDGTNSFWCEHGATCEEIVQGEKYSCKCPLGFAGEHCEHSGAPCGHTFCFHNAECLAETGDVCQCPSEWKGSADCSLPTTPTGSTLPSSFHKLQPSLDAVEMKRVIW